MRRNINILNHVDWVTLGLFYMMILLGWLNIYAAVYEGGLEQNIFDLTINSGKQILFIGTTLLVLIFIFAVDFKFFDTFAFIIYGVILFMLVFVLVFGREINGARSWLEIGAFRIQPSEFAKFATALALAKFMSTQNFKLRNVRNQLILFAIIGIPAALTVLQGDLGTAMIFGAFVLVLFREGMSPVLLIAGAVTAALFILTLLVPQTVLLISIGVIGVIWILLTRKTFKRVMTTIGVFVMIMALVKGVDFAFENVLRPHQQKRIMVLLNPNTDPLGAGWNVTQSKIAIGSGGMSGKGFLSGTQTKFDFVPEQSTDFIFCTIGEEHGWVGSLILISLFVALLLRVIGIAERQKQKFTRIYGYSVASLLFFHFAINIGMTIGLFPVIGIPLPFFSYGGSSLIAFTILIFILLKLDAHRSQMLAH